MGRLRTLTILLTLGAWGASTEGAPPDGPPGAAPPPASQSQRLPLPENVTASQYLEAAQKLYSQGDPRAAEYFNAAWTYRDMLSVDEQATLDQYRGVLAQQQLQAGSPGQENYASQDIEPIDAGTPLDANAEVPADAAAVASAHDTAAALVAQARQAIAVNRQDEARRLAQQAESMGTTFAPDEDSPGAVLADLNGLPSGTVVRGIANGDIKQTARWLLKQAREHTVKGEYDQAEQKIAEAERLNVHWGLFDETPEKVREFLEKERPKVDADGRGDRREAKARLKEARTLIARGELARAESIAQEVGAWGLRFGLFEDNPQKVLDAVRSIQRRHQADSGPSRMNSSPDLYSVVVAEARAALMAGHLEEAEYKAHKAMEMNVVPPLNADRADAVLSDIALLRQQQAVNPALIAQAPPQAAAPVDPSVMPVQGEADPVASMPLDQPVNDGPEVLTLEDPAQAVQPEAVLTEELPADQPLELEGAPVADQAEFAPGNVPVDEPPALELAGEPAPAGELAIEEEPAAEVAMNPGEQMLDQARSLMATGNFEAAKQMAAEARNSNTGVEPQADDLLAQIALAEQNGAIRMYEAALDALRKQEYDRARALLSEVATSEIQDEGMLQKVQDLLARIPSDRAGKASLDTVEDAQTVLAQKLNVEVGTKVAEARRLMETDPDKAIALLQETLEAVKAAGVSPAAARTMVRRVEVAIELAKKDKVAFDAKMQDKNARAEIEQKRLRILEADKAKQMQVEELMTKSKEAEAEGHFDQAEVFAKRAAQIDPNNLAAVAQAKVMNVRRHMERDLANRAAANEGVLDAFQSVDEAAIIDPELNHRGIVYAKDFRDLTRTRRALAESLAPKKSVRAQAIIEKLGERVTIDMKDQPLGEALDYLASYTGLNIVTDPKALADEGLTMNSPVTLTARDIPLKTALKYILSGLNLTYTVDDEVLLITSPQANRSRTYPVAYPVADLVISPHQRQNMGLSPVNPNASPVLGGEPTDPNGFPAQGPPTAPNLGAGLNNIGGPTMTDANGTTSGVAGAVKPDFGPLISLIKAAIAPGTWQDNPEDSSSGNSYGLGAGFGNNAGGGLDDEQVEAIGSITPFFLNISLIIRHTAEVHEDVVDLLRQLRRLQDLQVSIEVRFITVDDSFFEQIGVDFDFSIQSDVVGPKSSFAIPNAAATFQAPGGGTGTGTGGNGGNTTSVAPYLVNPARDHSLGARTPLVVGRQSNGNTGNFTQDLQIPFLQDSASAITPFNALTANTGATFGLAFLSDLEVYLFLTAVQGNTRSNLVQAPKVTTFNGAIASVSNFTSINFVQSLFPIVGAGAVAFQPNIQSIPDGVILSVTPVVSADRRYVRMTLSPFFQTFVRFDTFTVPAAVGGGGLGGQATGISAQVQLPVTSITNVNTTVTVPDGGTVLLGGVKRLREERREFGVPILSKTPLINRLFRNIGIGRTTDSLMLMVTPRIIILEEEEDRLGIPAVNTFTF